MAVLPSIDSNTTQTLVAIVSAGTATIIGIATIYQGHRAWLMWREHRALRPSDSESQAVQDLELGTAMTSNDDRALIDASGGVNKTQTVIDEDGATAETNGTQSTKMGPTRTFTDDTVTLSNPDDNTHVTARPSAAPSPESTIGPCWGPHL